MVLCVAIAVDGCVGVCVGGRFDIMGVSVCAGGSVLVNIPLHKRDTQCSAALRTLLSPSGGFPILQERIGHVQDSRQAEKAHQQARCLPVISGLFDEKGLFIVRL